MEGGRQEREESGGRRRKTGGSGEAERGQRACTGEGKLVPLPVCPPAHLRSHFMAGLPKIALARMKAKARAPDFALGPEAARGLPGAPHPDANLLAAFGERTLSEEERSRVLHHLAECAECREVAAFALPAEEAVAEPARVAARGRWNPWPLLRWGAMAAVLGALCIVVALHPGLWQGHQETANKMPAPVPATGVASPPRAVTITQLAPSPAPPAPAKARLQQQEATGEFGAMKKSSGAQANLASNDQMARAHARQLVTVMAPSRPPATLKAESVPAVKAEEEEAAGGARAAAAPAAPPTVMARTSGAAIAPEAPPNPAAAVQPGEAASQSATQSAEVRPANSVAGSAGGVSTNVAPRAAALTANRMEAHAVAGGLLAYPQESKSEAGPLAALWSVTSDGKVQRSTDGGKHFEPVRVPPGIRFRAIAALGNEVWTGGTGGALFHSANGGASWTRVTPTSEENTLTENIETIQLRDPQHLTVTTASGSQWISEDGGQHWR